MVDDLADLGAPIEDWILVLNILQGLNQVLLIISELPQSSE
jgi:hypothetical protein